MSKRSIRAAATARTAARREAERAAAAVAPRTWSDAPRPPAPVPPMPPEWWAERAEAAYLARYAMPSTADPDAVAARAERAAEARDALAVATGRAYGSPVRGYRSRKGRQWPGFSPIGLPLAPSARADAEDIRPLVRRPGR